MTEWTGVRDKRVLITGATRGIGLAGAEALARRGAHVAIVARDDARAAEAVRRIEGAGGSKVDVLHADLSSQESVRALARDALERYAHIEVLVNNAGAIFATRRVTVDGIEQTWALNQLAPFLLTTLLLERIKGVRARTHHHNHVGCTQGKADPVRRPERRALLQRPRLHALR